MDECSVENLLIGEKRNLNGLRIKKFGNPKDFFEEEYCCYYFTCPPLSNFPCFFVLLTPTQNYDTERQLLRNKSDVCVEEYTNQIRFH